MLKHLIKKIICAVYVPFSKNFPSILLKFLNIINNSEFGTSYITMHCRPKYASDISVREGIIFNKKNNSVAILIQGPIIYKNNFTLETIKLYKKLFPKAYLILSTWDEEKLNKNFYKFDNLCYIILSKKDVASGLHNVNYQIKTTNAALEKAREIGALFVLKTRTDHRFYNVNTLEILYKIAIENPSKIIELSMSTCKYRLWSLCDMFQFGTLEKMTEFWNVEYDGRTLYPINFHKQSYRVRDIVEARVAEIYLHTMHANKLDSSYKLLDKSSYFNYIKNNIVIIDKELIDLFWYKYSAKEYCLVGSDLYSNNDILSMISGSDYQLLMGSDYQPTSKYDLYLDKYEK